MAVITGTPGRDNALGNPAFRGTAAADEINGIGNGDRLFGNAGNDVLRGGDGDDIFIAGVGSPTVPSLSLTAIDLLTYDGADLYDGGLGRDSVFVSYAPVVDGVSPTITIDLEKGTVAGGNQVGDRFQSIEGVTVLTNGAQASIGRARLFGSFAAEILMGGDGDDRVEGRGGTDEMSGGPAGFDTLSYLSSPSGVTVDLGLGVAAQVSGGDANGDRLLGGFDVLLGSTFADTLRGTAQADRLDGDTGDDRLEGREGNDTYEASAGKDKILDTGGIDRIEAKELPSALRLGDDLLLSFGNLIIVVDHFKPVGADFPNAVETVFVSRTGQTLVLATGPTGGPASGIIGGTDEDDTLDGEEGDDLVFGNDGADIVVGGEGDDILSGGQGPDMFLVRLGDGNDVIKDFTVRGKNADKLDLTAFGFESVDTVLANLTKVEGRAVLTLGDAQTITFERLGGKLGLANLILEAEG